MKKEYSEKLTIIRNLPDIFLNNGEQIKEDFKRITKGRKSAEITDPFTKIYDPEDVFVEEGASIKAAILNAENGPIYIGKNATIHVGKSCAESKVVGQVIFKLGGGAAFDPLSRR